MISYPIYAAIGISIIIFTIIMVHTLYQSKRSKLQTICCWTIVSLFIIFSGYFLSPYLGTEAQYYTGFAAILAYLYLFDIPFAQSLYTYFFIDTLMYIVTLLARYTVLFLENFFVFEQEIPFAILYALFAALNFILFMKFIRKKMLKLLIFFQGNLRVLAVFASLGYVALLVLFDIWMVADKISPVQFLGAVLFLLIICCGYYMSFYIISDVQDRMYTKIQLDAMETQLQHSEQHYRTLTENIEQVKQIRHDMKHHLLVMDSLCSEGSYEELHNYICKIFDEPSMKRFPLYCKNYSANILLSHYSYMAELAGVKFECEARIPENILDNGISLCVILGNALENAIDACKYLPEGERYISLKAWTKGENLVIEVRNRFDGVVIEKNGRFCSRKQEKHHGYGLESIKTTVERYQGSTSIEYNESEFILKVILNIASGES